MHTQRERVSEWVKETERETEGDEDGGGDGSESALSECIITFNTIRV